jgi:hypothetical protein
MSEIACLHQLTLTSGLAVIHAAHFMALDHPRPEKTRED